MCGRYMITSPVEAIREAFGVEDRPNLGPRYNVAPTQSVPIVRARAPGEEGAAGRELVLVRWGLVPFWAKDLKFGYRTINARAETVATAPAFRDAFRRRRCLVVADGFYEWQKRNGGKQPYLVRVRGSGPFAFAGLWESWTDKAPTTPPGWTRPPPTAAPCCAPIRPSRWKPGRSARGSGM